MPAFSLFTFVRSQLTALPPVTTVDLTGKTVMVIGANVGLGFETAKHFARMSPARLVLACRSQAKGDAAAAEIAKDAAYTGTEVRLVDLSSFASVSSFATKFETEVGRLDVLVCNAGIVQLTYERFADGWESTLQVNHLSTALLSILLLPLLLKTARAHGSVARLAIVSSEAHHMTDIPAKVRAAPSILEALNDEQYCRTSGVMGARYPVSKLLNVLFARAINGHLAPTAPLIAATANPGLCYSDLGRNTKFPLSLLLRVGQYLLARTGEQGARVIVHAAIGEDLPGGGGADGMKGRYVSDSKVMPENEWIFTEAGVESERRIWVPYCVQRSEDPAECMIRAYIAFSRKDETIDILAKVDPRVRQIVDQYLGHSSG